uniref:Uncharacterized protein n=1 Tax=Arundo donax TaxID=35708 RepID=A0A0A9C8Z8_ARUDO
MQNTTPYVLKTGPPLYYSFFKKYDEIINLHVRPGSMIDAMNL